EGDPGDADIPTAPPYPGGIDAPPFDNGDDRIFEEDVGPRWGWAGAGHKQGHTKKLQDGENTMYIFHRQGNNTVFWDVFMWTDSPDYVPTDEDYQNATIVPLGRAFNPSPANGVIHEDAWVSLGWRAGDYAVSYDVYFGENFDDVEAGSGGTFRGNQASNHFLVGRPGHLHPDGLPGETTYYWRIDEVEADGVTKHKGRVWSFFVPSGTVEPSTVPTFHCIGIYWSPRDGSSDNVCQVHYRSHGSTDWKEALPLWYDDRRVGGYRAGYRGSIVNLDPGTAYEIELELSNTGTDEKLIAETWSEDFPIAKTVYLPPWTTYHTLRITESGSPDGYILYTAPAGGETIDVRHNEDYCVTVDASYVIIRGLNLKGAKRYGIRLYDCHDVVIEGCDISGFSSIEDDGWGNRGAAIFSLSTKLKRIIVQRNQIHHPYSDTNSWSEYRDKYGTYHPRGPKPISYVNSAGNHVIRYNEIYSDVDHYFEDCMSAGNNNFPNRDSDIYGNYVANCWDDGIEAEDDNCNVRIWGNFIEWTFVKIAVAPTKIGPVYIWRNVAGVGRQDDIQHWNDVSRGGFLKTSSNGGGKIFVFHNTLLQPEQPRGVVYPLGCGRGLGWGGPMLNTMSRNNILHIHKPGAPSIKDRDYDPLGDYDYDLYNGYIDATPGAEPNGIRDVPIYDRNNGDGEFALDPFSPGYDAGVVIPNFNDNYNGAAPDIGAHEAGSPPMEFGVNAYQ
ncbi:MAG: right-handed parallel beta-helix repeat-containing protein, partial [Planctomycetota bacterium]